jgi:hypothetical protein
VEHRSQLAQKEAAYGASQGEPVVSAPPQTPS